MPNINQATSSPPSLWVCVFVINLKPRSATVDELKLGVSFVDVLVGAFLKLMKLS